MFDAQCDLAALVYEKHQDPDAILREFAADPERQRPSRGRDGADRPMRRCEPLGRAGSQRRGAEAGATGNFPGKRLQAGPRPAPGRGGPGGWRDGDGRRPRDRQPVWQA